MSDRRPRDTPQHRMAVPGLPVVQTYARILGLRNTLVRSAYVLLNQLVPFTVLDCITLDRENLNRDCLISDGSFETRFLAPNEMRRLADDPLQRLTSGIVEERLSHGDLCYAVLDGDVVAMVGWYSNRPTTILGDLTIHFDPDRWYMYGALTRPEYRGRHLHALGVCRAFVELDERGVKGLIGNWERTHYMTIHSAVRMGWKRFGSLYRVHIAGRSFAGATRGCRAHGMRVEIRTDGTG